MGRAEKYANVLEEDMKNNKEVILSSTREIKFKDIHDEMEELAKEPTKEIVIRKKENDIEKEKEKLRLKKQETFMTKGDLFRDLLNKEEIKEKEKELDEISINKIEFDNTLDKSDDIIDDDYIDSGFGLKKFIFILIIFILLLACAFIFVYPVFKSFFVTSGSDVFTSINDNIGNYKLNFDNKITYQYNYSDNENNYSYIRGFDGSNKLIGVSNNNSSINYYFINNSYYINYNDGKNLYSINNDLDKFNDVIGVIKETNVFDYNNVIFSKESNIFRSYIVDDNISRSFDKIKVNDKNVSAFRNTIVLEGKDIINIIDSNCDLIANDIKFKNSLEFIFDDDIDNIINNLFDKNKYKDSDKISISLYTNLYGKLTGFDIEKNGFRIIYCYWDSNYNYSFYINLKEFDYILNKYIDCSYNLEINGKKDSDKIKSNVIVNNENIGELIFNSIDFNSINFDFNYKYKDTEYKGSFMYMYLNDKYSIEYKINDINFNYYIYNDSINNNRFNVTMYDSEDNDVSSFNEVINNDYNKFNDVYKKYMKINY